MKKIRKKIEITFSCDKCGYTSNNEEDFVKIGNFELCLKCFKEFEDFIQTCKGQTIENFIFEEK